MQRYKLFFNLQCILKKYYIHLIKYLVKYQKNSAIRASRKKGITDGSGIVEIKVNYTFRRVCIEPIRSFQAQIKLPRAG